MIIIHHSHESSDPMMVSQADALQAEASTKLKGMLASAAVLPPAPVEAAATPVVASSASAAKFYPKQQPAAAASETSSVKRLRDASDERDPKKPKPANIGHPKPESKKDISADRPTSAQITGNPSVRSSDPQSSLPVDSGTGLHVTVAIKPTEASVSSLEEDRAAEDVQAKVQAELAW
jgi:hypothetical protein